MCILIFKFTILCTTAKFLFDILATNFAMEMLWTNDLSGSETIIGFIKWVLLRTWCKPSTKWGSKEIELVESNAQTLNSLREKTIEEWELFRFHHQESSLRDSIKSPIQFTRLSILLNPIISLQILNIIVLVNLALLLAILCAYLWSRDYHAAVLPQKQRYQKSLIRIWHTPRSVHHQPVLFHLPSSSKASKSLPKPVPRFKQSYLWISLTILGHLKLSSFCCST